MDNLLGWPLILMSISVVPSQRQSNVATGDVSFVAIEGRKLCFHARCAEAA